MALAVIIVRIGVLSAAGSVALSRRLLSANAEQVCFALILAPMQFVDLLVTVEDESVAAAIETLRQRKIAGAELDRGPAIPEIRAFVEAELGRLDGVLVPKQVPRVSRDALDELFRTTLERAWMAG